MPTYRAKRVRRAAASEANPAATVNEQGSGQSPTGEASARTASCPLCRRREGSVEVHVGPFTTLICSECDGTIGHAIGMAKWMIGLRERFGGGEPPEKE